MKPRMTVQKFRGRIRDGHGVGVRDGYRPWIEITKKNTSSRSMQCIAHMPGLKRLCHYLSLAEFHMAHMLLWLGVEDLREQFPLWAWPHDHPLEEVCPDTPHPRHPGILAVAEEAKIKILNYPGLALPALHTTDLVGTWKSRGETKLGAFSCKPKAQFVKAAPSDDVRERLELDRRYWDMATAPHRLVHPEQLPHQLMSQLIWLAPVECGIDTSGLIGSREYYIFLRRLSQREGVPAHKAADEAARGLNWSGYVSQYAMRTAMWRLDVDVNPMQSIEMTSPLASGGRRVREHFRTLLL